MDWLGALRGGGKSAEERQAERLNKKAANLIVRGQLDEAETLLSQALKVAPNMGAIHHNLGTVYLNQRKFDPALKDLRRAVRLDPSDVESKIAVAKV